MTAASGVGTNVLCPKSNHTTSIHQHLHEKAYFVRYLHLLHEMHLINLWFPMSRGVLNSIVFLPKMVPPNPKGVIERKVPVDVNCPQTDHDA